MYVAGLRIAESDIWFHLRNAQYLLTQHAFIHADLYTFTSAGTPLVNHEWLSEIPYLLAYRQWGLRGLVAVYTALLFAIYASVFWRCLGRCRNALIAALTTLLAVALGTYSFGPRMMHFGWACMVVLLLILDRFERTGRGLWLLPPLLAVWINLHGSWVFGLVVLGTAIACGLGQRQWGNVVAHSWAPAELKKLAGISAACIAALFANPYGYKLVVYPFDLLLRQGSNMDNVVEWQSVDFHTGFGKLALFVVIALLATAWFSKKRWTLRDVVLTVFALSAALLHVRFLFFAGMIVAPVMAAHFATAEADEPRPGRLLVNAAFLACGIVLAIAAFPKRSALEASVNTQFPNDALRWVRERQISGRIFHDYDFGGYIEWHAPELKTFADGRTDIFVHNGVFDDYLTATHRQRPFEILDKYDIAYVLVARTKPIAYILDHSAAWRVIYADQVAKLYERAAGQSQRSRAPGDGER